MSVSIRGMCVYVCVCLSEVPFLVQRQMVGPGKTSFAVATLERFGASVLAVMAGQFVRPGKAPATSDPFTFVRFFACKYKFIFIYIYKFIHTFT